MKNIQERYNMLHNSNVLASTQKKLDWALPLPSGKVFGDSFWRYHCPNNCSPDPPTVLPSLLGWSVAQDQQP